MSGPKSFSSELTPELALSIARAAINRAKNSGFPQAIFRFAEGVRIRASTSQIAKDWFLIQPNTLVGVYTASARAEDISADILDATEVV